MIEKNFGVELRQFWHILRRSVLKRFLFCIKHCGNVANGDNHFEAALRSNITVFLTRFSLLKLTVE